jgi:hypothetical protein
MVPRYQKMVEVASRVWVILPFRHRRCQGKQGCLPRVRLELRQRTLLVQGPCPLLALRPPPQRVLLFMTKRLMIAVMVQRGLARQAQGGQAPRRRRSPGSPAEGVESGGVPQRLQRRRTWPPLSSVSAPPALSTCPRPSLRQSLLPNVLPVLRNLCPRVSLPATPITRRLKSATASTSSRACRTRTAASAARLRPCNV